MKIGFVSQHRDDDNGNPAGGTTEGVGFKIEWQNGPLGRDGDRKAPNGAFVEDIIGAALDRIEYYQKSRFKCDENEIAAMALRVALTNLNLRTQKREARRVEGTHAA